MSEPAGTEPRPRGRPSEYRDDTAAQAERLCRLLGATDAQLAAFFEKGEATINRWKYEHPEFAEALRRGKTVADLLVNDALFTRAQFYEFTEEQAIKVRDVEYDPASGKKLRETERVEVVSVKRVLPPCTTAMIYWHKNRQPDHWRDKQQHEHSGSVSITISPDDAKL